LCPFSRRRQNPHERSVKIAGATMTEQIMTMIGWQFGKKYKTTSGRITKTFPNQLKKVDDRSASSFFARMRKWIATEAVAEFDTDPVSDYVVIFSVDCTRDCGFRMSQLDYDTLQSFLWDRVIHD
jgi:hypothetical protein